MRVTNKNTFKDDLRAKREKNIRKYHLLECTQPVRCVTGWCFYETRGCRPRNREVESESTAVLGFAMPLANAGPAVR